MTQAANADIPDVQGRADKRKIAINKVGIKDIRHPNSHSSDAWPPSTLVRVEGDLLDAGAAIAAVVMYIGYRLPWERMGWKAKPWEHCSIVLPLVMTLMRSSKESADLVRSKAPLPPMSPYRP